MILLQLLFACGEGDKTGSVAETPTGSQMSVNDFENIDCQDYEGTPTNSAATYYVGNFVIDGTSVSGVESAFLIASDKLSEVDDWSAGRCEMHWSVSGETTEPEGCASCAFGISLQGEPSLPDSTCPDGLQDEELVSVALFYNVKQENETVTFYMPNGDYLGTGVYLEDGTITYVSDEDCKQF